MVGGGLIVLDVEQAAEGCPQGGGELGPAVRCDDCWDSILLKGIASSQRDVLSMIVNR
jgi:hypothetical protein